MAENQEELRMIASFFEEAVLILKKLPLFSVYRNDREMKMRYFLEYYVLMEKTEEVSLFDLPGRHFLQRQNDTLTLKARVAYRPSLESLVPREELINYSKRKESATLSDYNEERTFSVSAFYDPDENFHFLSSDE